jgi:hypothetical protein
MTGRSSEGPQQGGEDEAQRVIVRWYADRIMNSETYQSMRMLERLLYREMLDLQAIQHGGRIPTGERLRDALGWDPPSFDQAYTPLVLSNFNEKDGLLANTLLRKSVKRRKAPAKKASNEAVVLGEYMGKAMKFWKADCVPQCSSASSLREIDMMLSADKRSPKAVGEVIRWLFCDYKPDEGFDWRMNVQSGEKLRKHFDKLEYIRSKGGGGTREEFMTGR